MIRYADDFVILCRNREEAEAALERVRQLCDERGLDFLAAARRTCLQSACG